MQLKILLPFQVFYIAENVKRLVFETSNGSYGLLQERLDFVSALVPGILTFETDSEEYIAIDEGVMIKTGKKVLVSVRNAIRSPSLEELHQSVKTAFKQIDKNEKDTRAIMAKMESGFILSLEKFSEH